jgi:hypothetical protein
MGQLQQRGGLEMADAFAVDAELGGQAVLGTPDLRKLSIGIALTEMEIQAESPWAWAPAVQVVSRSVRRPSRHAPCCRPTENSGRPAFVEGTAYLLPESR